MIFFSILLMGGFIVLYYKRVVKDLFSNKLVDDSNSKRLFPSNKQLSRLFAMMFFSLLITNQNFAQTFGLTATGSTSYPQTTMGAVGTGTASNAGDYLIFDSVRISSPLTAVSITTYGSVSGTISVTIYNDNGGTPGTKLFTEVAASVTASTASSITIPNTYLAPGVYWLAYDMSSNSAQANFITKTTTAPSTFVRKDVVLTYGTSFPNNPTVGSLAAGNQDYIAFNGVAIQGYVKATEATLSAFASSITSVSFYASALGNLELAIYSNSSGAPSTLLWQSASTSITSTGINTINISAGTPTTLTNLSSGTYWLAWQWTPTTSPTLGPSYTAGSAGTGNYIIQAYGAFPATWTGGTSTSENWTDYATYVPCITPTAYSVTGGGSYCSGGSGVSVGLSNSQTNVNYQLYNGATPVGSAVAGTGSAISFGNQTTATTYTVIATNIHGSCTNNMTGSATVTINAIPSQTITAPSSVCGSSTGNTASVPSSTGGSYSWTISGGTITGGSTTNSITFTAGASGTVTLSCVVTSSVNCSSAGGQNTGVTINAIPSQTITAPSSVCANSTGNTASVPSSSGGSYSWTISGGTITAGSGTNSITFTAGASGTVTLSCVVTSSASCSSAGGQNTSVTINANPSASVSGQSNVSCSGGSDGTITILASGGASPYSYSVNNGTSWTSSSSNPYVFTGLVANQAYQIRVKDNNGCVSKQVQ